MRETVHGSLQLDGSTRISDTCFVTSTMNGIGCHEIRGHAATLLMRLRQQRVGKRSRTDYYVHRSVIESDLAACDVLDSIWEQNFIDDECWNVIRVSITGESISLLSYPQFEDAGHPCLSLALKIDLHRGISSATDFRQRKNAPVLHRKELLVGSTHVRYDEFASLTQSEVEAGLLQDAYRVGFRLQWEERLAAEGFTVDGHNLIVI